MDFDSVQSGLASKSFVMIDVRNPGELLTDGKIPGSHNIPCKSQHDKPKKDVWCE